jgi:hypothetical protein
MKTATLFNKVKAGGFIECRTCLFDTSMAMMNKDGECEYCKLQTELRNQAREPWENVLNRIKHKGWRNKYDCLIGISGGEDSSVLLYLAVKVWKLRPLVIHFNNRTNRPEANNNIKILTEKLSVNFIEYFLDKKEYDNLTDALLKAGVPDCDIANDVCMSKMMYTAAKDNGIKYILNGHSFREEGSSPKAWSVIDYTYLNSIFKRYNGHDLVNYPLLTVWDQIKGALLGIKQVRPYHYADHGRQDVLKVLKSWGWQDYGGKHNENIYTAFIGSYVLPKKFGIDKRRTYLSAHIREGKMSKEQAYEILQTPSEFNLDDLGEKKNHLLHLVNSSPIQSRSNFKMTNFKMLRPVFWLLMKFKVLPVTAYRKYCA